MFSVQLNGQVKVYDKFDDFESAHLKNLDSDTTYIVNFWATWCVPCVEELPYFETLNSKYKDQKVKILLVSLDIPSQITSKLLPFLKSNSIVSEVVVLADGRANDWIDKVDPSWSGAIPVTLFLKGETKSFFEKQYDSFKSLEKDLLNIIK